MKKKERKDQEKRKQRRLRLDREAIRILMDPVLLERARGGIQEAPSCPKTSITGGED